MNYSELKDKYFCQSAKPTPEAIGELVKTIHDYCGTVGKPRIHIKGNDTTVSFGLNSGDIVETHPCYNYCNYKLECTLAALRTGKRLRCIFFDKNFSDMKHDTIKTYTIKPGDIVEAFIGMGDLTNRFRVVSIETPHIRIIRLEKPGEHSLIPPESFLISGDAITKIIPAK